MKKAIFFLVLILCVPFLNSTITKNNGGKKYVDGQVMVMLRNDLPQGKAQALSNILSDFSAVNMQMDLQLSKRMNIYLLKFDPEKIDAVKLLKQVRSNSNVILAQFNHFIEMRELIPNDANFNLQWNLNNTGQTGGTPDADLDCPQAWEYSNTNVTATGDTIIIANVDDGFDLDHEDLYFWKNWHDIPGNGVDDDNNGYIDDYDGWNAWTNNGTLVEKDHGTHTTGIAAARGNNGIGVSGVNIKTQVLPVVGSATIENIVVAAYAYVVEMRALYNETNGLRGAFIVSTNSSFGVDYGTEEEFPIWAAMYDSLGYQGILNAAATANSNVNVDEVGDCPTSFSSNFLITVTNTDDDDLKSSFAGYGQNSIDLGAPGTQVYSTRLGNAYGYKTGCSMSAPHVAGAVAYMFGAASEEFMTAYHNDPAGMALVMKEYLLNGTDPLPTLAGITVSGGRLNVYNAAMKMANPDIIFSPMSVGKDIAPEVQDSVNLTFSNNTSTQVNYTISYPEPYTWTTLGGQLTGILNPSGSNSIMVRFNSAGISSDTLFTYLTFNYGDGRKSRVPVHLFVHDTIIEDVSVDISASEESVCPGSPVELSSHVSGGLGTYTYTWTSVPAGVSSTEPNITVNPEVTTTYYLVVNDISGKSGTDFFQVLMKQLPGKPTINSGPDTVDTYLNIPSLYTCTQAPAATSYAWYVSPTEAGSCTSTSMTGEVNWSSTYTGGASVTVVGLNDCGIGVFSDEFTTIVYSSQGIRDHVFGAQLEIFPVPAKTVLSLKSLVLSAGKDCLIDVYSLTGVLVDEIAVPEGSDEVKIDVSGYKPGVYTIILKDGRNLLAIRKAIISH